MSRTLAAEGLPGSGILCRHRILMAEVLSGCGILHHRRHPHSAAVA